MKVRQAVEGVGVRVVCDALWAGLNSDESESLRINTFEAKRTRARAVSRDAISTNFCAAAAASMAFLAIEARAALAPMSCHAHRWADVGVQVEEFKLRRG